MSGFHVGLTAEIRLANNFYLSTGAIYSAKGYEYESKNGIKEDGSGQYIDIPLLASMRFPAGKNLKFELNAGPYVALCVGGKVSDEWSSYSKLYDENFSSIYSGFDYGAQFGVGMIIAHNFRLDISYQLGMEKKYQNRNLMFSLGYRF